MGLYKPTDFQGSSGQWYCNDVSNLAGGSGNWWNAARAWGVSPAAFIEMLIKDFHPDKISYSLDKNVLVFSWNSQIDMRAFKNATAREARKRNFCV